VLDDSKVNLNVKILRKKTCTTKHLLSVDIQPILILINKNLISASGQYGTDIVYCTVMYIPKKQKKNVSKKNK